jgi:hypothetical protein
MVEVAKLYLTSRKLLSPNMGIISLTNKGITVYLAKGIMDRKLRGKKYLDFEFKDIAHITLNFILFKKAINIFVTKEKYKKMMDKHKILDKISQIFNSEQKITLDVRSDSKSEVIAFIDKFNKLAKSKNK